MLRVITAVSLSIFSTSCGGGEGEEAFDTFQDCFDDHHLEEGFDSIDSIKICCIDHPIAGNAPNVLCGETAADCETFVDFELDDQTDVTLPDIEIACDEYIVERDL